jgi:cytochrome c oxidase subunit 2
VTANEIHVPVGRTIEMRVTSADVIHSFWVPNLAGKIDMMPGRTNVLWLRADHPGVFRGQCAEYCGAQHARMALLVIAEPEAEFERWRAHQRADAAAPRLPPATQGLAAFARLGCPECHTVRGLAPGGRIGPDLTHVAGRRTLAGATLANNGPDRARWVVDAPAIKPGTPMPSFAHVDAATRESVLAFLAGLE